MQTHVKYLVVEDIVRWSQALASAVTQYFSEKVGLPGDRILRFSAYDGDQANQHLTAGMFDLVTLDMNLGAGLTGAKISGRDVLGEIAHLKGGRGAYFIIIITGAIHEDDRLEACYGKEIAARMRYSAYNDAVQQVPAERVRIIHKPNTSNLDKAINELIPHLNSALDQYCAVSLERNIFRPLKGTVSKNKKTIWEFRYNGGLRRTIEEMPGFEMCRSALAQPNLEMQIVALMKALARSSGTKPVAPVSSKFAGPEDFHENEDQTDNEAKSFIVGGTDPRAEQALGLDFDDLDGFSILPDSPMDAELKDCPAESVILALLDIRKNGGEIRKLLQLLMHRDPAVLYAVPARIAYYLDSRHHIAAKNEFGDDEIFGRLRSLLTDVNPIVKELRETVAGGEAEQTGGQGQKKVAKLRITCGVDPKEAQTARQQWRRVLAELRHNELDELAEHLDYRTKRGLKAKGRLTYYFSKEDGFPPFWLTR